jgi:Zn-dependent protease
MSWSVVVGRPFGVPLRVHASFVLVLLLGATQWGIPHGARGAAFGALVTLALFLCVVLHELGHSVAARAFGIRTKQILLLPIGGVAELDGKARRPAHELVIALAGPMVNVVIAAGLVLALGAGLAAGAITMPSAAALTPSLTTFGLVLLAGNGMLALFNMLPLFPLDGGRVLRALLAFRMGEHKSLRVAAMVGQIGAFGLGIVALLTGHVLLALIAGLVFVSASSARAQSIVPDLTAGLRARDVCEQGDVVFEPTTTIDAAIRASLASPQTVFPVALGTEVIGLIGRDRLRMAAAGGGGPYVTGLMAREWPRVTADQPLGEVLAQLSGSSPAAAVYDEGSLIGFVSADHVYGNVLPLLRVTGTAFAGPRGTTRTEVA